MLNRLSVNSLLQSAIAVMAFFVVVMLAQRSWESYDRLASTDKIMTVADASRFAFTVMHSLRTDRASTFRTLKQEGAIEPSVASYIQKIRALQVRGEKLGGQSSGPLIEISKHDARPFQSQQAVDPRNRRGQHDRQHSRHRRALGSGVRAHSSRRVLYPDLSHHLRLRRARGRWQ